MKPNLIWQGYSEAVDEKYATQAEQRMGTFQRTLKKIEEYVPNKGRLLDIGCAAGFFLKVAQDADWSVEGIEPNRGLAEWGQKKYGLPIKTVDFLNSNYPPASFEVITFWDVLEHVHDPRAYLHEAYSILKPGGFIFINFPDFGSRLARIFGEKWWFLSPVHIYYFDRRTLKKMMEDEGYDVKVMMAHSQTLSLGYLFKRFADYSKFISNVGMKVSAALRIDQLPIRYYASQALAVAKKPDRS